MPSIIDGCSITIALMLATAAAFASAPGQADDAYQKLHLLFSATAPSASAMAEAVGDNPRSLLPP